MNPHPTAPKRSHIPVPSKTHNFSKTMELPVKRTENEPQPDFTKTTKASRPHPENSRIPERKEHPKRQETSPLQTLSTVCKMRFAALLELVRPLSDKEVDQEAVVEAVQTLNIGREEKEIEKKMEEISTDMADTYEAIIERDPEIGIVMSDLTKVGEERDALVAEIAELERENEASKPKVTKAELKQMQENQKKFEMMLNTQQTKYQLRYTKAKGGVEAVAASIASIQNEISALEKRIILMNQKGSQYSHKTHSHQHIRKPPAMEGTEEVNVDRPKTYRRSGLPKLSKRTNM